MIKSFINASKYILESCTPKVYCEEDASHSVDPKDDDDEEELVDPQVVLKEKCAKEAKCQKLQENLTTCNNRVNSRKQTKETCFEELMDFVHCVDHCVAKDLFNHLK